MGHTSLELDDAEGAFEAFTKLLELVPTAVDLWPHLAAAYLKAGNIERATEAFETTLTYEPNNIVAINNLAILRENDGHIAEAIDLYRRATDIEPHVADLHANLGIALEESGALANALVAFETAIHCAPDEPERHIYRGSILKQLGRVEDAIAAYTDVQELYPENFAAAWGSKLTLPVVYETPNEIQKFHDRWRQGLTELDVSVALETPDQIEAGFDVVLANPNFLLHYQGGTHRDDQEAYGALVHKTVNAKYPALG